MRLFVPELILNNHKLGILSGSFTSYSLFIDISGFTNMTQKLMKNGKEGAEILSEMINDIFSPSIDHIYKNGGFITTFAGDAFTALFPVDNPNLPLSAAIFIKNEFIKKRIRNTKFGSFELSVKIGLSYGNVNWQIIKNEYQNSFYFMGEAINNCAESEHRARSNEIIFDRYLRDKIDKSISYQEITREHFLLTETSIKTDFPQKTETFNFNQSDFVPKTILNSNFKGEFRDIVSCFISFDETNNLQNNLSHLITLSNKFGGYFNKIDFGDKGGIALVLFGAPIAQEYLFQRACDFSLEALKIQDFPIKIGLTFGTVFTGFIGSKYRMEYTALGMVVNLSARYAIYSQMNKILIDNPIYANIKDDYKAEYLGEKYFRGFEKPIKVYELQKKLFLNIRQIFKGKLTGRKKELAQLKKTAEKIFSKNEFAGITYIDGEAGIGKTRLVESFKEELLKKYSEDGFYWFFMPCDEILKKSFNPIIYTLQNYFGLSTDFSENEKKQIFESVYQKLYKFGNKNDLVQAKSFIGGLMDLHWQNSLYEQLDAKNRYENTIYAIKLFFKTISKDKPLIMELDDAHWIDQDSKKMFESFISSIENNPIYIIAPCRYLENGKRFSLNISPEIKVERLELSHFDKKTSREFIITKLNELLDKNIKDVDNEFVELITEKTNGNPFYIEQIILYLIEKDLINHQGNLISKNLEIPSKISTIIIARIDRLTDDIKEMIKTASVLGKEFYLNILSKMLMNLYKNYELRKIESIISKTEHENIIAHIQELKYVFKHALIRETVYEIQLKQRLRKLHKLAAETIKEIYHSNLDSHYDDLAYHYEFAEEYIYAIETLSKAILFAKKNFRNLKALQLVDKKLYIYDKKIGLNNENIIKDYITTLLEKKYLHQLLGELNKAQETIEKAEKLSLKTNDSKINAKIALDFANLLKLKGNFNDALSYLNKAFDLFKKTDDKLLLGLTYLDLGIVNFWMGNIDKAFDYFKKELETFILLNEESRISEAYGNLGVMYRYVGEFDKAMYYLNKQLEIVKKLNDKIQLARTYSNIGWVYEGKEKFDYAIKYYEDSLKLNKELGLKLEVTRILDNMGFLYQQLQKPNVAISYHNDALIIAKATNDIESIINIYANLGHAYKALHRIQEAHTNYDLGISISLKNNLKHPLPELYIEKAEAYITEDKKESAKELLEKGLEISKQLNNDLYVKKGEILLKDISGGLKNED